MNTETITWHPASEPPDTSRTVLTRRNGRPVQMGRFDANFGRWTEWMTWHQTAPDYWAELPRGPQA